MFSIPRLAVGAQSWTFAIPSSTIGALSSTFAIPSSAVEAQSSAFAIPSSAVGALNWSLSEPVRNLVCEAQDDEKQASTTRSPYRFLSMKAATRSRNSSLP